MEKVLLQIMDNGNEKAPINEYKWNRRLAIEYSFYKPDKFNVLNYDFTELLYHDSNKAINIAFKIFDAVKDQYFKIIKDSKELLKIENVEYFGELNFKIFCDMILFKDVIKIDLNEEYDDKHELILHHIKIGNWQPHCYNKMCFCLMKADIHDKETDEKYPLLIFLDNHYYSVNLRKEHKWYKKLWTKIKWKYIHYHKKDRIIFKEKEIYED